MKSRFNHGLSSWAIICPVFFLCLMHVYRVGAAQRPNLIVVLTDDQRFDALGANGNPLIHTPHLDRLAQQGVRFTDAHVVMSLCSPSRAAILTGRYGSANGVTGLGGGLYVEEVSFAELLREAGYRTAMVGKWHIQQSAEDLGFDFTCTFQANGTYFGRKVDDNGTTVKPEGHVDAYCVQRSIDFLDRCKRYDEPFLLFHATQLPHMDHTHAWPSGKETRQLYDDKTMPLPGTWQGDLTDKPPTLAKVRNRTQALKYGYDRPERIQAHTGDYYAVVTEMDAILGRLFRTMDRLQLWDNTWLIFLSDNGWLLGEHGMTSKVLPYDPSVRVPMVVAGPNVVPRSEDRIALNIDIAPTLLDLAGLSIPSAMQGRSLVPLLRNATGRWRDHFVYECIDGYGGTQPLLGVVTKEWKLLHTWKDKTKVLTETPDFVEFYDRRNDPDEVENLANAQEHHVIRQRMAQAIDRHRAMMQSVERTPLEPVQFSGIYPHLATFNQGRECGTGAVVPWADRLWVITYMPHGPGGSDDKLYEITPDLQQIIRPESIGGTPANRMIHRESRQLFIGPYAIDALGKVRTIPYDQMYGRPTGNARHLSDPEHQIYYATMEEGFYEVDVNSLAVTELYPDANRSKNKGGTLLPGYHGKGLYSGQGRLVYANNGENTSEARKRPDVPSGVLATWDGNDWTVVQRNQFTEVMGPGGLYGNADPATDPIWSIGWDHRSLLLMLLDQGQWHRFRLPKASHCYDGAHGWNTEWPRIRDIGAGDDWLMTMHGMFWHFPRGFRAGRTSGIAPRSTYLKVIGDFCRWGDRLVIGCDDSAKAEFLNTRKAKGKLAGPGQSQSNLWFIDPAQLDSFGPALGRGAVWLRDDVQAGESSDPFLFSGFDMRSLHLGHDAESEVVFNLEVDREGKGQWESLRTIAVSPTGYRWVSFDDNERGTWVRLSVDRACQATAWFAYRDIDHRSNEPDVRFTGLARLGDDAWTGALVYAGDQRTGLQVLTTRQDGGRQETGPAFHMGSDMQLSRARSRSTSDWMQEHVAIPQDVISVDRSSVLYVDDQGNRFRLPIGFAGHLKHQHLKGKLRVAREVCTERDLFQAAGIFYELPARNAGGFPKVRPIATHPFLIQDYCTWRGLMVLSGVAMGRITDNPHIIRSQDGTCALWVGAVDDLWTMGKARGQGGPWFYSEVKANETSDPYLMTGFDRKSLELSHTADEPVQFRAEVDISGEGHWVPCGQWTVTVNETRQYSFPKGFSAYWIRFTTDRDTRATAMLTYE